MTEITLKRSQVVRDEDRNIDKKWMEMMETMEMMDMMEMVGERVVAGEKKSWGGSSQKKRPAGATELTES